MGRGGDRSRGAIVGTGERADGDFRASAAEVVVAVAAVRRLAAAARAVGLSLVEAQVVLVCAAQEDATAPDIAHVLNIGRPHISSALVRLRALDIVLVAARSRDGRVKRNRLSAVGVRLLNRILSDSHLAGTVRVIIDNASTGATPEQPRVRMPKHRGSSKDSADRDAAVDALITAARLGRILNRFASKAGMEPASLQVLLAVSAEADLSVNEIAERLGLRRTHTSAALAELYELGFVSESRDPDDARRHRQRATPPSRT